MAQNKYLDYNALSYYDGKLKAWVTAADDAVLAAAKKYTDEAPFDPAGTAQTKVDALANGQVKENTEAIAKLNGGATEEGSVAKTVADAKAIIDGDIDAVEEKADAAQAAADKAQEEVDALETYVGTFTHATAKSVVEYVDAKTAGIATDAALSELQGKVTAAEGEIAAIKGDYLKGEDKTALQDQITANAGEISTIKGDYLKAADKTELQGKIDLKAAQTVLDAEIERATGVEEGLQNQINTIMNNPDAEGAINSINEFTQYVTDHGTIAEGFRADIDKNKEDIAAEVKRAGEAEGALEDRIEALEAIDNDAYIAADTALKNELNGEIGKKADQTTVDALDEAYKAADTALDNRLKDVEGVIGDVESVATAIATAKQEAIDSAVSTAAGDATTKANTAESNAKSYTDSEIDKVEAVANKNKEDIAGLVTRVGTAEGEIDDLQAAIGEGGSVTAAIADAKKAGTDAQGEVDALEGVVSTLSGKVTANEGSISAHGDRLTALEGKVGDGFVAITNGEIDTLFAQNA